MIVFVQFQITVRHDPAKVRVGGEQSSVAFDDLSGDQRVDRRTSHAMTAARVADLRRPDVVHFTCRQEGETCHGALEFAKLLPTAHSGEQFLEHDSRDRQRCVVGNQFPQRGKRQRFLVRLTTPTAKGERQNGGIQNDHRLLRSAL